jgi:hypothetical protein
LCRTAFTLFTWAAWLAPAIATAQPAARPSSPPRADVVLLGPGPATAAVKDVTAELLARQQVDVSWATQAVFQPQDIFAPGAGATGGAIAVWIDLWAAPEARLYFRDVRTDRFFLRSVPLARGIDEIAVLALSTGLGETLTRPEARVALHLRREPELRPAEPPSPRSWRWSATLLLGGQPLADELPLAAQASAVLALGRRLPGRWSSHLGGWASLGYQFAAEYRGSMVGATVQSAAFRAGLLWTVELSRRLVLGLALGGGADRIHDSPQAVREEVVVAPADTFYVPTVGLWGGLDVHLVAGLSLSARVSSDLLLQKVHFDLHDSAGRVSHVIELYSVRPGASLGFAYDF